MLERSGDITPRTSATEAPSVHAPPFVLCDRRRTKKKRSIFIAAFTRNSLSPYWGHPEVSFQNKRPSEGCIVEVLYVLGRKQCGCCGGRGGGLQRWFPGTRCSRQDPGVKFLWDLKELEGGLGGVVVSAQWASLWPALIYTPVTAPADRFGSTAESPVGATRHRCQNSLLSPTHKHTWHTVWRSTSADLEFLFRFPQNCFLFFFCISCQLTLDFLLFHLYDLINRWVSRQNANNQHLMTTNCQQDLFEINFLIAKVNWDTKSMFTVTSLFIISLNHCEQIFV